MTDAATVRLERHLAVVPGQVFDAWLDPAGLGAWLFATPGGVMESVAVDPRIGGGFHIVERRGEMVAEHFGEYVTLDRARRLAFDFWTSFSAERTRVTIDLAPDGDGTLLILTHEGVWADYEGQTRQGWTMIVDSLGRHLATTA